MVLTRELFTHIDVARRGGGDDHEVRFEFVDPLGVGDGCEPVFECNSIDLRIAPHENAGYHETVRTRYSDPEEEFRPPARPDDGEPDGPHPS